MPRQRRRAREGRRRQGRRRHRQPQPAQQGDLGRAEKRDLPDLPQHQTAISPSGKRASTRRTTCRAATATTRMAIRRSTTTRCSGSTRRRRARTGPRCGNSRTRPASPATGSSARRSSKPSHHPIVEGKVQCHSCHEPHGAMTPVMLKAETHQDLCLTCHTDKRGPWIWEHRPVTENCATCHTPHGSSHNRLLAQKPPALCADCHPGGHTHGIYDGRGTLPGRQSIEHPVRRQRLRELPPADPRQQRTGSGVRPVLPEVRGSDMNRKLISVLVAIAVRGQRRCAADDPFTWSGSVGVGRAADQYRTAATAHRRARATSATAPRRRSSAPRTRRRPTSTGISDNGLIGNVDVQGSSSRYYMRFFGENFGRDDQYLNLRGGQLRHVQVPGCTRTRCRTTCRGTR